MYQEIIDFTRHNLELKKRPHDIQITKLFGQASTRIYYRIILDQGKNSYVIMRLPKGFASPAEEVTKTAPGGPAELPFLNIQRYLKNLGIRVPEVYAADPDKGLILLEDLGDKKLEDLVRKAEGPFFLFYYKKALDQLIELQKKTLKNPSKDCVAFYRRFDEELLDWEFRHFLEYGIEDRLGVKLSGKEKTLYTKLAHTISRTIAHMPQGFVERDFQSRNILFKDYEFVLIDFQDALVGPIVYDLVSLLRDSYVNIKPDQLSVLIDDYYQKLPEDHPYAGKKEQLIHDFHLITLQRKLKDAGRFQYIKTVKGNPEFLKHIPQSLAYVRHAFDQLGPSDERERLQRFIAKYTEDVN